MKKYLTISNEVLVMEIIVPIIIGKGYIYMPLLFIPIIVEKIFKHKYHELVKIMYYIYVFMAVYLGGCLKFYKTINGFDTCVHTMAGFVLTFVGIYIFNRSHEDRLIYKILFMFVFSMACASMWEITEFSMDEFFKMNWQRRETGVIDTMKDMCVHLAGTITLIVLYIIDEIVNNRKIFDKLLK